MNLTHLVTNPMLSLLLVAGLVLAACMPAGVPALVQGTGEDEPLPVPVQVAPVETGNVTAVLSYSGNLHPVHTVDVTAGYTDDVVELHADVGDTVQTGDILLAFDTTTLNIQQAQAQAAVTTAEMQLAKMRRGTRPEQILTAQAALNLAQANLSRIDTVTEAQIEAAAGGVAQAQAAVRQAQSEYDKIAWAGQIGEMPQAIALEQTTTAYETALANYNAAVKGAPVERLALEASLLQAQSALALARDPFVPEDFAIAEAGVQQARTALELVQTQLDEATVTAPVDGVIAARYVSPGETPGRGRPLFTIISNEVEAIFAVEEGHIGDVYVGQPAAIRVVAYPGRDFAATVTSVSPAADPKTHTFTVKVTPADKQGLLKSGMFADVSLLVEERAGALLVPKSAVRRNNGEATVFVVKENQVEVRPVILGIEYGHKFEVLKGLEAGEQVVVSGQSNLSGGSRVEVVSANQTIPD